VSHPEFLGLQLGQKTTDPPNLVIHRGLKSGKLDFVPVSEVQLHTLLKDISLALERMRRARGDAA
jgi:hypothetical protein